MQVLPGCTISAVGGKPFVYVYSIGYTWMCLHTHSRCFCLHSVAFLPVLQLALCVSYSLHLLVSIVQLHLILSS